MQSKTISINKLYIKHLMSNSHLFDYEYKDLFIDTNIFEKIDLDRLHCILRQNKSPPKWRIVLPEIVLQELLDTNKPDFIRKKLNRILLLRALLKNSFVISNNILSPELRCNFFGSAVIEKNEHQEFFFEEIKNVLEHDDNDTFLKKIGIFGNIRSEKERICGEVCKLNDKIKKWNFDKNDAKDSYNRLLYNTKEQVVANSWIIESLIGKELACMALNNFSHFRIIWIYAAFLLRNLYTQSVVTKDGREAMSGVCHNNFYLRDKNDMIDAAIVSSCGYGYAFFTDDKKLRFSSLKIFNNLFNSHQIRAPLVLESKHLRFYLK